MSQTTFYWHDYETFGANPRRDRPAQFAGIRTDADLNIIGEPLTLYCQPPQDTVPHPEATLITGITPQIAQERGVPEPEFIARIIDELAMPGTCGVGYNSINFDDELTRHTLWRNFYDPYAREWQNGCSRWDIINVVRLTYALRPDGIEWPTREDGAPSFRLEHLAAANNLEQENAHDALSDVHATIALARLIRERQPKLWAYVLANRTKNAARDMLDLRTHQPVLHVSHRFPATLGCLSPVMPLAPHPTNKNEVICYDLRHDPAPLLELSVEDIAERLFTPTDGLPEGVERIAIKGARINKSPVLAPMAMLKAHEAQRLQIDQAACKRHQQTILEHIDAIATKAQAVYEQHQFEPSDDAETALYEGFVGNDDRKRASRVPGATGAELADADIVFDDSRLNELLFRYRARNCPDTLNAAERDDWNNWVSQRLEFAPDGGLTLDQYDAAIDELTRQCQGQPDKLELLQAMRDWGSHLRRHL